METRIEPKGRSCGSGGLLGASGFEVGLGKLKLAGSFLSRAGERRAGLNYPNEERGADPKKQ